MEIKNVNDKAFKKYGKVIKDFECSDILAAMKKIEIPSDVVYVPGDESLEACASAKKVSYSLYGGMPVQIGYCNGHNKKLNAFEYHRDSEINIAATDLVLILGSEQDIEDDFSYDTAKAEAFLVPEGTVIEVYATTLHYAPCSAGEDGFRCVVVLPRDTNLELNFTPGKDGEDKLITARNKWLIAHEDAKIEGAFNGLKGENITL